MTPVVDEIPSGWQRRTVRSLGSGRVGTVQTGPFGAQLHAEDYVEDGIPLLLIRNLQDGRLGMEGMPRIRGADAARLSRYALQPGDVVFSRVGRVGSCFLADVEHGGWLISGQLLRVRIDDSTVDNSYLYRALTSGYAQDHIRGASVGTTRTSINTQILESLELLLPTDRREQSKIAEILSTVDRAIEQTDALIAKQQRIKNGLMQDLLTRGIDDHGNLRSEQSHEFKDSLLGRIPVEWGHSTIRDALELMLDYRGRTPKKLGMEWGSGRIPALSANNVEAGQINLEKETYYGSDALYQRWMGNRHAAKGDVVMTTEAPLGNVAQVPDDGRYILSQRVVLMRARKDVLLNSFLRHYLMSGDFQDAMAVQSSGTTATGIQRRKFEQLHVPLPHTGEQDRISSVLDQIDGGIRGNRGALQKLHRQKSGLMRDLLSGDRRVTALLVARV